MWYSNRFRRHLMDMHIDDWHQDFLSRFSPEAYVENLKLANINYAMLYLQSHAGLCYWPTKTGQMHRALEKNPALIRKTAELCLKDDIKVCGYYSLIYNTREHDRHPDWRMIRSNGASQREAGLSAGTKMAFSSNKTFCYGLCCPNNPDYKQFVFEQIDEMLDYFPLDALFFDMPFWNHTCYCRHCQEKYRALYGHGIPVDPAPYTPEYNELNRFKGEQMGVFIQSVTAHIKKRSPDMPIEHNFAGSIANDSFMGCFEPVAAACDYVGGDLYGNLYNHSFACKYFRSISPNQPFEQMFSRCKPALTMHTLTKSLREMKTAVAVTMAHHGATLVIDAIDPVGTMDERVYRQMGKVFEFQKPYEPYFTGQPVADAAIYYGLRSRAIGEVFNSRECCKNLGQTFIRGHIPFDVTGSVGPLSQYPFIAAPVLTELEDGDNTRLIDYVNQGGILYLSGFQNRALVETLTGHILIGQTEEENVYIAPAEHYTNLFGWFNRKYPMPFDSSAPMVTPGNGAEVIATLTLPYTRPTEMRFSSIHSDPPGISTEIPAITLSSCGKGKVLWSALPLEFMEYPEYREVLLNLFRLAGMETTSFLCDAPGNVEITAFRNQDSITVNAVALQEEDFSRILPFTIKVRCPKTTAVHLLPKKQIIPFTYKDGYAIFSTRTLDIFDMYQIIL